MLSRIVAKILSRFFVGLTSKQLGLSLHRGRGVLRDLEVNTDFVLALLGAPAWLCVEKVICHEVKFQAKWTRIRSRPMEIWIDRIDIVVKIDPDADPEGRRKKASIPLLSGGNWGFVHAIVEGMRVCIAEINIQMTCGGVDVCTRLVDMKIGSVDQAWNLSPLQKTRVRDRKAKTVTVFKEVTVGALETTMSLANAVDPTHVSVTVQGVRLRAEITRLIAKAAFVRAALQAFVGCVTLGLAPEQARLAKEVKARLSAARDRIAARAREGATPATPATATAAAETATATAPSSGKDGPSPRRRSGLFRRKAKAAPQTPGPQPTASAAAIPEVAVHARIATVVVECEAGADDGPGNRQDLVAAVLVHDVTVHAQTKPRAAGEVMEMESGSTDAAHSFHADWLGQALLRQDVLPGTANVRPARLCLGRLPHCWWRYQP